MKKILKRNSIAHITGNMVREDALQQRLYWAAAQKEEALLAHYGAAPTGLTQEQAEQLVGTPMVYRGSCFPLGEDQMCGKSMDDRACFVTLLRAAELLRDSSLSVLGVAQSVGYGSASQFSAAFRRQYGMSPTVYRKMSERA